MDASASPLCYTLASHCIVLDIVVVIRTNYGDREGEKGGKYVCTQNLPFLVGQ